MTQPIKQAHREIYLLTDAERQTQSYSNRFAAHILRQHQFTALCQQAAGPIGYRMLTSMRPTRPRCFCRGVTSGRNTGSM